jgi:peptidyl-prolyl cis-trans isomerase D
MLDSLRRGTGNWLAKGLLLLLIVAFAVWGVADVFRGYGSGAVAHVGKTEIGVDQFQQAYQAEMNQMSAQFGRRLTPEQARMLQLESRVLSRLVGSAALDTQAQSLGLRLSDGSIAEAIRTDPSFAGIDGKFSKPAFDGFLRQNGLSEAGYLALRQREAVREQLTDSVLAGAGVPQLFVDRVHRHREETRIIEYATIDAEKVIKVAEPEEGKLREYFEANKRRFMTPAYRKIALLTLLRADTKKKISVSDEDAKAAYEQELDKYNTPERRRILQVAFPDKAAAERAYGDLSKAANFLEAAGKLGFKEGDVDLGTLGKKDMIDAKIADAAFALKKGEVSKPVEGRFSTVILSVTDITPAVVKTFDAVKAEVVDRLADERATRELQALHDKVDDERAAGRSLKEAGEKVGVGFREIEAIDSAGNGADGKKVLDHPEAARILSAAFGAAQGIESEAVQLADGGYAWVDVLGSTPEKERAFEDVTAEVRTAWTVTERERQLGDVTAKLVERLIKGEGLDAVAKEAGGKAEKTNAITRSTSPQGLTADAVRQAFALPKGSASSAATADRKSRVLFRVADVTEAAAPTKEQSDKIRSELKRSAQLDTINAYVGGLQNRYGVTINEQAVRQLLGLDQTNR